MLNSVTKKFTDKSTIRQFKFVFYCDCCEKPVVHATYDFISGFKDKVFLTGDEREARAIIYASDHKKAYERANIEARFELNKCDICGDMVCDDCTVFDADLNGKICCKNCHEKRVQGE